MVTGQKQTVRRDIVSLAAKLRGFRVQTDNAGLES